MSALAIGASASARRGHKPAPALPRFRAPVVFGLFVLMFIGLALRSFYLQSVDNEFLQEQGSSRYSRQIDVPAHRGRIVDRSGDALAISTPVKSLWAFPGKVEATREQLAQLARILETTPQALAKTLDPVGDSRLSLARFRRKSPSARCGCGSRGSTISTNTAASTPVAKP